MTTPKTTYSEKLKHPKWQKKRLEILNRDKFTCKLCGDTESTLHVHHLEYKPNTEPWDYPNANFKTLCEYCHREIENLKAIFPDVAILEIDKFGDKNGIYHIYNYCANQLIISTYNSNNEFICGHRFSPEYIKIFIKKLKKIKQ